jgi:hypothetical protein
VKSPKVTHIALIDPERILASKSDFANPSGIRRLGFHCAELRNPSPVGPLARHAKLEYRCESI